MNSYRYKLSFGVIFTLIGSYCSTTRVINEFDHGTIQSATVYMMHPISESIIQVTKDSSVTEYNIRPLLDSLVNSAFAKTFTGFGMRYDSSGMLDRDSMKIFLDRLIPKLNAERYKEFDTKTVFRVPTKYDYILIPYFKWIRTTKDYRHEYCGRDGYKLYVDNDCTWTEGYCYIFVLVRQDGKITYYNRAIWASIGIHLPNNDIVNKMFNASGNEFVKTLR